MKKEISLTLELLGHKLCLRFNVSPNTYKLLEGRNKSIVYDFRRGYSIEFLAEKHSLTPNRVSQILITHGARQPKWRKMSLRKRKTIFQLYEKGLPKAEIGRRVGISRERVRQIIQQGI